MARNRDKRTRINKTVTVDVRILLAAEANKLKVSEFIEKLFDDSIRSTIPDSMPLEDKQAAYVELDRKLRALGSVIADEKEAIAKAKADGEKYADKDRELTDSAVLAVTDNLLTPEGDKIRSAEELARVRCEMLAKATQGRVSLSVGELLDLARLRLDARRVELEGERKLQEARLKVH